MKDDNVTEMPTPKGHRKKGTPIRVEWINGMSDLFVLDNEEATKLNVFFIVDEEDTPGLVVDTTREVTIPLTAVKIYTTFERVEYLWR